MCPAKYCSHCYDAKPVTMFYRGRGVNGRWSYCKECCKKQNHGWRWSNLDKARDAERDRVRARNHGMTRSQLNAIVFRECGACGIAVTKRTGQLDHCHATGAARGILCMSCNLALGHVKDSVGRLNGLVAYLGKYHA